MLMHMDSFERLSNITVTLIYIAVTSTVLNEKRDLQVLGCIESNYRVDIN